MPARNLERKGLRPRPRAGRGRGRGRAKSRKNSPARAKSGKSPGRIPLEFGKNSESVRRNSGEIPARIPARFRRPSRLTSADFGRASAGLGHLIKVLQIRNPSSLRRGLDTLIKFLHKSGLLSSLRRGIQVSGFSLPLPFIGRPAPGTPTCPLVPLPAPRYLYLS